MARTHCLLAWFILLQPGIAFAQQKIAFVSGVERYQKSGFKDLEFAEDDANDFKAELERHGFVVDAVIGDEATLSNLQTTLKRFYTKARKLAKNDVAIVYLSGHGTQKAVARKNAAGNPIQAEEPFFCPTDALKSDVSTLLSLNEILTRLEEDSGCDTNLILLDACRDSSDKGGKGGIDGSAIRNLTDKLALFFAAKSGHRSFEARTLKHGIFTHYLLEGLRGKAADEDKDITLASLVSYVTKRVEVDSPRLLDVPKTEAQRPNLMGNLSGSIVLGRLDIKRTPSNTLEAELVNSLGMKLVLLPAGEFLMGSTPTEIEDYATRDANFRKSEADDEQPQHRVKISRPFYLGATEVTRGQFAEFVKARNYKTEAESDGKGGWGYDESSGEFSQKSDYTWRNPGFSQTDSHPVVNVSWNDAVAFCEWLSKKEGVLYQLPTEAQWEYACRGGAKEASHFWIGNDPESLAAIGNVADGTAKAKFFDWATIESKDGNVFTAPVGRYRANGYGLQDMHGNVWEWCSDKYGPYSGQSVVDPSGSSDSSGGSHRVSRGGSWFNTAGDCRSAVRDGDSPDRRDSNLGFRVSLVPAVK